MMRLRSKIAGAFMLAGLGLAAWGNGPLVLGQAEAQTAAPAPADPALIQRGEYLARAADCAACHAAPSQAADVSPSLSGGRAFTLPFGTIYAANITPDKEDGVGAYSDDEWVSALRRGVGRGGRHLYPAMPYTSYAGMTRDDALAIKAWVFAQAAVHVPVQQADLKFPFNQRWLMLGWNIGDAVMQRVQGLFNATPRPPAGANPQLWARGAYLVDVLGHCEQCHTPRNFMFGVGGAHFAGAGQVGWRAWNLTADPQHGIGGWSDAALRQYLSTGQAPGHGPASGPMAEAIGHSLRYLTPEDTDAIATYLRGVPALAEGPMAVSTPVTPAPSTSDLGRHVFLQACAGCHLPNGQGRQSAWAALGGAHSMGDTAGTNIVAALTEGTQMQTGSGLVFMHPFTASYTDTELAAVSNYLIGTLGGRAGQVTPAQIHAARKDAPPPQVAAASGSRS